MSEARDGRIPDTARRVASLDVGSNTVLMLCAERGADGTWRRAEDHAEITRISEGLDATGVLGEGPIARTRDVVARLGVRARDWGADLVVATGTAPFRRSRNGADVAAALGLALGAPIDVVSGEEEAELGLLATRRSFPEYSELLVIDIGGASTELIHARADGTRAFVSVDVGSVRLAERVLDEGAVSDGTVQALDRAIDAALSAGDAVGLLAAGVAPCVGIAGTVTTVATVAMAITEWDEARVHGARVTLGQVGSVFEAVRVPLEARRRIPGLEPKRADVFPAGARLLWALMRAAGAGEVIVSDRGVRWGRLYAG